jgi:hypothetical protein
VDGEARGHPPACQGYDCSFDSAIAKRKIAGIIDSGYNPRVEIFCWIVVVIIMAIGLIGTVLPIFPGAVVILGAAILHRVTLGPDEKYRLG